LARHGHRLPMIQAMLEANGFHEADVFPNQPYVHNQLVDIADRVRRGEQAEKATESSAIPFSCHSTGQMSEKSCAVE
jgi:hypothetical protein